MYTCTFGFVSSLYCSLLIRINIKVDGFLLLLGMMDLVCN